MNPDATELPPLAIIGMGCLFPGSTDRAGYWSRIVTGFDAIRDVPSSHWRAEDYFDPDPKAPDRVYLTRGGFLDPISFEPQAHGIPPNSLEAIDSVQLLGLLVAQQALADSGYTIGSTSGAALHRGGRVVDRNRVSVVLGVTGTLELVIPLGARLGHPIWRRALRESGVDDQVADEVVRRISAAYVPWTEDSFPGLLGNVVAGRIANRLDLGGTNCVVDAACASSLAAVHLAALELATGRADLVLTGGVDAFNDIFMFTCFSKTPALSPTGDARPFDSRGDGTVLGEGLGLVVLKRHDEALRDGDRIYAVLRGVGSSSDGHGGAIYAPRAAGQVQALRAAYRAAGVSPETIELVEAHGTGTRVGDATELSALTEVFSRGGRSGPWCALGSVKSQIGHTKAAAGAAGLIKAALALHHKVLPPTIKVVEPLEPLRAGASPFYACTEKRPWMPSAQPRRAAVSAFGFGGSNFHCVLEEADPRKPEIDWDGTVLILACSAQDASMLRKQLKEVATVAAERPGWEDLGCQAARCCRAFDPTAPYRVVLVVERDRTDLARLVESACELITGEMPAFARDPNGVFVGSGPAPGGLAVLFPGQGSHYPGMLRDLACHIPAFHDNLASADLAFARAAPDESRLSDCIYPLPAFCDSERQAREATLRATEVVQPALGAVSLGAWRVLEGFGVRADAFAGHSYGELTALCAAGRLSADELVALSRLRGILMVQASREAGEPGAMLAVKAPIERIERILRAQDLILTLANKNAPDQTVLSGAVEAIERVARVFSEHRIPAVRLNVAAAFHSDHVAGARIPFRAALERAVFRPGAPVWANATAARYPEDPSAVRDLLAVQLARPVLWWPQVKAMHDAGLRSFLEVGPGTRLTKLIETILAGSDRATQAHALDESGGRRSGFLDLAYCLAWLAARGHAVRLDAWERARPEVPPPVTRPTLTVSLCGANYVRPLQAVTARPAAPTRRVPTSHGNGTPLAMTRNHSTPSSRSTDVRSTVPSDPAAAVSAPPAVDDEALAKALELTREGLAALQQMQEQTAALHRQFLDGQLATHQTVHLLVEQQQKLLQASLGGNGAIGPDRQKSPPAVVPTSLAGAVRASTSPVPMPAFIPESPAVPVPPALTPIPTAIPAVRVEAPNSVGAPRNGDSGETAKRVLLEVVSEKTGYPVEMLGLEMALDSDLGIDSIKRVEILSALQDRLPNAPSVKPEHLGSLRTLGHIVTFLGEAPQSRGMDSSDGLPRPADPGSAGGTTGRLKEVLLEVVSEKTGYPVEMLGLEMALDSDLGIDSIKRVEILSALQDRLPNAPSVKPEHLGSLRTLGHIVTFLGAGPASSLDTTPAPTAHSPPVENHGPVSRPQQTAALERSVPRLIPVGGRPWAPLAAGSVVWFNEDDPALTVSLVDALRQAGLRPRHAPCTELAHLTPEESLGGLLIIAPLGEVGADFLFHALRAVQHFGPALRRSRGVLLTVSRLDGGFGLLELDPRRLPLDGALAGLSKTVGHEWGEVRARAVDVSPQMQPHQAAQALVEELGRLDPVEVGLTPDRHWAVQRVLAPLSPDDVGVGFEPGEVIVVSGGARGVTAEVAAALAEAYRPTLVLLGRSPAPEHEPGWLTPLRTETEIKRELASRGLSSLRAISERCNTVLAGRAIRNTLERLAARGARVIYHAVDVRDPVAVTRLLEEIRRQYGPIRGLIHGAGVLADARIEDKMREPFDRVWKTKVDGLLHLLAGVGEDLRALVLFSSSTARFGRAGQVDYAMANEALNKIARQESLRRPGCRVVSLNWGPWAGGMVTPELARRFAEDGVGLIPPESGAAFFLDELRGREIEVVVLAESPGLPRAKASDSVEPEATVLTTQAPALPTALPTCFERLVDLNTFPVLGSHILDGRPVVPLALLLEWLAHAALHQHPGLKFHGCDNLQLLQGVIVDSVAPKVRVGAGKGCLHDGLLVVPAEVRSVRPDGKERLHARAEVILADELSEALPPRGAPVLAPTALTPAEAYSGMLFHGPDLHGLEHLDGLDGRGIAGRARVAPPPASWLLQPLRQRWITDPLVLDTAFQMMIIWSMKQRGAASLPSRVGRYRQYQTAFPAPSVSVAAQVTRSSEAVAVANVEFLAPDGRIIAEMEHYECIIDASLGRAFRRPRPSHARR